MIDAATIRKMSPSEIQTKMEETTHQITELKMELQHADKKLVQFSEQYKKILPNMTDVMAKAAQLQGCYEKRLRIQRSILSLHQRYPALSQPNYDELTSTDISYLRRQSEQMKARFSIAQTKFHEEKTKNEKLKMQLIELEQQRREQNELLQERERTKSELLYNLNIEYEGAKSEFSQDLATMKSQISTAQRVIQDFQQQVENARKVYDSLRASRADQLAKAPTEFIGLSQTMIARHEELVKTTSEFVSFWRIRRHLKKATDRTAQLKEVFESTRGRYHSIYHHIDQLMRENEAREMALKSSEVMITQLNEELGKVQVKRAKLEARLKEVSVIVKPLPPDVIARLKAAREKVFNAQNKVQALHTKHSLISTSQVSKYLEQRFEENRLESLTVLRELVQKRNEVAKLKKQIESKMSKSVISLATLDDPLMMLSHDNPIQVVAAPLETIVKLIFNPANEDPLFNKALLVMIYSLKDIDTNAVVKQIISAYEHTEYIETRQQSLLALVTEWCNLYVTDQSMTPLLNIAGVSTIDKLRVTFEAHVNKDNPIPYDPSTSIPFSASPSIIAEHITFWELKLTLEIPPSELINCRWTGSTKLTTAPKLMKLTDHFNTMSQWIVVSVLTAETSEMRNSLITRWIAIMSCAERLCNFQLVFEIYGAFCHPAIGRLKNLMAHLSPHDNAILDHFKDLTSPVNRLANYRQALSECPMEITLPYIGPDLTSLVYINDGNLDKRKVDGSDVDLINFQKFRLYAETMSKIVNPWMSNFVFQINEELLNRLKGLNSADLTESELFELSRKIEP